MMHRPSILLRGSERWVRMLEDVLPEAGIRTGRAIKPMQQARFFRVKCLWRWWRADVLHQVMVDPRSSLTADFFEQAHRRGTRVVAHWIGSDVLRLRDYINEHGTPPERMFGCIDLHLADSPALAEELRRLGVEADVSRLLPRSVNADISPLPDKPAALVYLPAGAEDFYRIDIVRTLAELHPSTPFYVVANDGHCAGDCPPNMRFLGEVSDMDGLYRKSTVLIRICEHDSLSAMVLEALARGRHVIYSETFPHTQHARNAGSANAHLTSILTQREPNREGARHVAEHFSWRKEVARLQAHYQRIIANPRR